MTSEFLTNKVAVTLPLLSCRVQIEEDDERFAVEKLERGERKLIIKKVNIDLLWMWSCVVQ